MVELNLDIPESFLQEEVRCGYTISKQMKEVWAVELDLLNELTRVCKKYDLKIYACAGTLLGAIRHQGIIPWDDDIDVAIFREDYMKLCEVAAKEFKTPYFFQTEYTDPGSLRGHAQLRNSQTTAILESERGKRTFNQGIFIDIFPLDAVSDDLEERRIQAKQIDAAWKKCARAARLSIRYERMGNSPKELAKAVIHGLFGSQMEKRTRKYYQKHEELCQRYNDRDTEIVSILSYCTVVEGYRLRSGYRETKEVPFEFITIPVGIGYDELLTNMYGDYMKMVQAPNCHGEVLFDTDRAYDTYL